MKDTIFTADPQDFYTPPGSSEPIYLSPRGVTRLRSLDRPMNKIHWPERSSDYQNAYEVEATQELIPETYPEVLEWVKELSTKSHTGLYYSGHPEPYLRRTQRRKEDGFLPVRRQYMFLDLDKATLDFDVDVTDPDSLLKAAFSLRDTWLPKEWWGKECVFYWSSSAFWEKGEGVNPRKPRCRFFVYLDKPYNPYDLMGYVKKIPGADNATVRPFQPNYTAAPTWAGGLTDPLAWRYCILEGDKTSLIPVIPKKKDNKGQKSKPKALLKKTAAEPWRRSEPGARAWFERQKGKVSRAGEGQRRTELLYFANRAFQYVEGGALPLAFVRRELEKVVSNLYAGESNRLARIDNALELIKDSECWAKEQGPLVWEQKETWVELPEVPVTHPTKDLAEAFEVLHRVLDSAFGNDGTTVVRAATGARKTGAMIEVVTQWARRYQSQFNELKSKQDFLPGAEWERIEWEWQQDVPKVLVACPTNDIAGEVAERIGAEFKRAGVQRHRLFWRQGRNEHNCENFERYKAISRLKEKSGFQFCSQVCPLHANRGGNCKAPAQPHQHAWVVVCSHELAPYVARSWKPTVFVRDESIKIKVHSLAAGEVRGAIDRKEITGATEDIERLRSFVTRSEAGEKVLYRDLQEALKRLSIELDLEGRTAAVEAIQSKDNELKLPHYRALEALAKVERGAFFDKGNLNIPSEPEAVEAPRQVVLDATVTPKFAQRFYGDHTWCHVGVPVPEHVEQFHIPVDAAKRAKDKEGFKSGVLGGVYEALKQCLPEDTLWVGSKGWDLNYGDYIHFDGTEARGSNNYKDKSCVVAADRKIPRAVIEAFADFYSNGEPSDEWRREVEYQKEVAPMLQALGRIRPWEARAGKPKLLVTLGSVPRCKVSPRATVLEPKLAVALLAGKLAGEPPVELWEYAAEFTGIWQNDEVIGIPLALARSGVPRYPKSPLLRSINKWDTLELTPGDKHTWHRTLSGRLLSLRFKTGKKGGATRTTFLAPPEATSSEVEKLIRNHAEAFRWLEWEAQAPSGEVLFSGSVLEDLRVESIEDLEDSLEISRKVAGGLVEKFGGWEKYQAFHATPEPDLGEPGFPPLSPVYAEERRERMLQTREVFSGLDGLAPLFEESRSRMESVVTQFPKYLIEKKGELQHWSLLDTDFLFPTSHPLTPVLEELKVSLTTPVIPFTLQGVEVQLRQILSTQKRLEVQLHQPNPEPVPLSESIAEKWDEPLLPDPVLRDELLDLVALHHDVIPFWVDTELWSVPKEKFLNAMEQWGHKEIKENLYFLKNKAYYPLSFWGDPARVRHELFLEAQAQGFPTSSYDNKLVPSRSGWVEWLEQAPMSDIRLCYIRLRLQLEAA